MVREVTSNGILQATFVDEDFVFSNSVDEIKLKSEEVDIKFLLGLLNSRLISFYHKNTSANAFKGTFPKVLLQDLRELPIRLPDYENANLIIDFVDRLLNLNVEISNVKIESKQSQILSKIDYCENKINELVYQLYGLTDDEIKIIENN